METKNETSKMIDELRFLNKLTYRMQDPVSVVEVRTQRKHFSQRSSYTNGQVIVFDLSQGAEYVNPRNSYLVVEFTATSTGTYTTLDFGSGSFLNCINRVILRTKDGREASNQRGVNFLRRNLHYYQKSKEWRKRVGAVMGYKDEIVPVDSATAATYADVNHALDGKKLNLLGNTYRFVIPMSELSELWNTDSLMPQQLVPMRIELELVSANEALVAGTTAQTGSVSYTVSNPYIITDSYALSQPILRALNEDAAKRGLEIPFVEYELIQTNVSANTGFNSFDAKLSVSRALWSFIATRVQLSGEAQQESDEMGSVNQYQITQWQTRLGAMLQPTQPVSSGSTGSLRQSAESYAQTLMSIGKYQMNDGSQECGVSFIDYNANDGTSSANGGQIILAQDLERSGGVINYAGVPINNSRQLQWDITYSTNATTANKEVLMYIAYLKLVRSFIVNTIIKQ